MRRRFYTILTIIILIILVDQSIGFYMTKLYERNFCQHSGGDINWYLKKGKSDVVFIGSSRVNTMIDNQLISKGSVNLSKPGKHLYYNLAIFHLLKQYHKLPQSKIILNIELEDFLIENEMRLVDDVYYLKYYYHKNSYIQNKINKNSIYEPIKFLSKSYLFNGENFKLFTNQFQNICDEEINGYYPLNSTILNSKYAKESSKWLLNSNEKINYMAFREIVYIQQICKLKKIKLYILLGPRLNNISNENQLLKSVVHFCKKNEIELLNFSQSDKFKQYSLWADRVHLNKKGSEIYTEMIRQRINN